MSTFKLEIAASTLRESLSDIVSRVFYRDERFIITKNGRPAAALVPVEDYELVMQLRARAERKLAEERWQEAQGQEPTPVQEPESTPVEALAPGHTA